jgi:hypothetical protein
MPDELSNAEIALLCDIEALPPGKIDSAKAELLRKLVADGFVSSAAAAGAPPGYRLTAKAHTYLTDRGVGLHEA